MKKLSTTLALLSFIFALVAVIIAITGTISLKHNAQKFADEIKNELAEIDTDETIAVQVPEESLTPVETLEPKTITPEELGFTFIAPNEWGAFNLELLYGRTGNDGGGYHGTFANKNISYLSTIPENVVARGGYVGDLIGYRKTDKGYEVNFINMNWSIVPANLILGTIKTADSEVLIIGNDAQSEGPSIFPQETGSRAAVINITNGPVSGGIFLAGANVTRDEFREFLESIDLVDAAE